ncbi:hypothetical protein BCV69DRAFT_106083 [Microstroma glucosiphilum]|uniref:Uncharacterized protein n=1 Tax=Pseudomicrostroma glucosiphilum TaxID=1684307 RepID=A0A316UGJ1_9BASI|nr:hypothetical protein BCV69DRAFT_106083 [Pseudomicrostroma glucosiphilum]PWN23033.1 hypothetical protein BCV69DRAFT_106083 [Pseudomicrostroma glucosiphilum]
MSFHFANLPPRPYQISDPNPKSNPMTLHFLLSFVLFFPGLSYPFSSSLSLFSPIMSHCPLSTVHCPHHSHHITSLNESDRRNQ